MSQTLAAIDKSAKKPDESLSLGAPFGVPGDISQAPGPPKPRKIPLKLPEQTPPPSGWLAPEKKVRHIILAGPAWVTGMLLELLCKFLERFGCEIHIVRYRGFFGDSSDVSKHSLSTYIKDARSCFEALCDTIGSEPVYGIGISMGAPVIHQIAQENPSRFCGVTLFASPMMGWTPKWGTLLKIVTTFKYFFPILTRSGKVTLKRDDAEDLLFGGFESPLIDGICSTATGGKVISQMLFGQIKPNAHEQIAYTVIAARKEKFHSNDDKKQWAHDGVSSTYLEAKGDGSHFGTLLSENFHMQILFFIDTAFKTHIDRKRQAEGAPTKALRTHYPIPLRDTSRETLYGGVEG